MLLKIAGFPPFEMRVSDVISNVRLPTVKVIALVSTLLTLPEAASDVRGFFFALTGAVAVAAGISVAGGAATTGGGSFTAGAAMVLLSCPRENTGAANNAQTAIFRIV